MVIGTENRMYLFHINCLEKVMNSSLLPVTIGKIMVLTDLFNLGWQPV